MGGWAAGDRRGALAAIPDEVVDDLLVHGPPAVCRERVQQYVEAGLHTPIPLCCRSGAHRRHRPRPRPGRRLTPGRLIGAAAYDAPVEITYEWRGDFASAEANALHAECFDHPVLSDAEWDWRGQVEGHSLGWVCARDEAELVGFVNVAWDGVVHAFVLDTMVAVKARRDGSGPGWSRWRCGRPGRPGASGCTSTSTTTSEGSTSTPAGSPRPTPG